MILTLFIAHSGSPRIVGGDDGAPFWKTSGGSTTTYGEGDSNETATAMARTIPTREHIPQQTVAGVHRLEAGLGCFWNSGWEAVAAPGGTKTGSATATVGT